MSAPAGPNIVRPAGTPNVGPSAINTMEMSIAKQKAAHDKKGLAAAKKAVLKQKCVEAQLALVRLLIPPTTHHDSLRVMSEQELLALTYPQLAAQAALLMTSADPQGMIACGGIATVAPKEQGKQTLGKLATESLSKTTKVTKTAHIFIFSLLYNSDFVNFVKSDNELNLSSVGFVTFDRLCTFEAD